MSAPDISKAKKITAVLIAIVAGVAMTFVWYMIYTFLGVFTHVIAMCSDAPRWWSITYLCLSALVLVPGYFAGKKTHRWYIERDRYKMTVEE